MRSSFMTGSRRMRCSAIRSRASEMFMSGVAVTTDLVAMSARRTPFGSSRSATTRTTRSRSVTSPTKVPSSSTTGTTPVSKFRMRPAASAAVMFGLAVFRSELIA